MSEINKDEFRKYAVKHHRINSIYVDKFIGGINRSQLPTGMTPYVIEERPMPYQAIDVFFEIDDRPYHFLRRCDL